MFTIYFRFQENDKPALLLKNIKGRQTILEIALNNGIPLPHACGGACICSTCHVYITTGSEFLEPPSRRELDFLKKARLRTEASRLGCQSLLLQAHGMVEVEVPLITQNSF